MDPSEGESKIVPVWYPSDHIELALVKNALDAGGLEYVAENENYYFAAGSRLAIGTAQLRILVRQGDALRAREIILEAIR